MPGKTIEIVEVGVRDGLQNEPQVFPTPKKLTLIEDLIAAGVKRLEVASFVHPGRVPQMADAEEITALLPALDGTTYIGLVLNMKGLERALKTERLDEIGCVAAASDAFGQNNQGQTSAESVEISKQIITAAKAAGRSAQVTVSAAFGCPFEGLTPVSKVIDIIASLAEAGPGEIAIADTIGAAVPNHVTEVFERAKEAAPGVRLRGHFHNTRNTAVANSWAAYQAGARIIDASIGGLGGCPFAPKATGNVATEDITFMFERSGVKTGLDLDQLIAITTWLETELGRSLPAMVSRAGPFPTKDNQSS
ncbi:MAG: hydroxymethylglutaryl-CoA lyase [Proteobacteria bacterium]|nr:hydroxymethylglutaryl-CoA lyase [Pseudomonadota bacterium]